MSRKKIEVPNRNESLGSQPNTGLTSRTLV